MLTVPNQKYQKILFDFIRKQFKNASKEILIKFLSKISQ